MTSMANGSLRLTTNTTLRITASVTAWEAATVRAILRSVMENVVYNHLVRLGYEVTVGQLQASEIDFVCSKPTGERVYVQVAYIIADDATRQIWEFGNLRAINDNYPKYVISMTPLVNRNDDNGIIHLNLRKFLTEGLV